MLQINLLNGKVGSTAKDPVTMKEADFWRHTVPVLCKRKNLDINPTQERVLIELAAADDVHDCFHGEQRQRVLRAASISSPTLSAIKRRLLDLDIIYQDRYGRIQFSAGMIGPIKRLIKKNATEDGELAVSFVMPCTIVVKGVDAIAA